MKKFLAILLLISGTLSACSSQPHSAAAANSSGGPSPSLSPSGSGAPSAQQVPHTRYGLADGNPYLANGQPLQRERTRTPDPNATLHDNIYVVVNKNDWFGCTFRNGDHCKIPWVGNVYLYSDTTGMLYLAAYENGSKTPAMKAPAPVPRGFGSFQTRMPYTVGASAKTVTFHAWLEGSTGKVLAEGTYQTFEVTPPAKK